MIYRLQKTFRPDLDYGNIRSALEAKHIAEPTSGMNAHVSKPVEMKVLEKTIRSIRSGGGHRTAGH